MGTGSRTDALCHLCSYADHNLLCRCCPLHYQSVDAALARSRCTGTDPGTFPASQCNAIFTGGWQWTESTAAPLRHDWTPAYDLSRFHRLRDSLCVCHGCLDYGTVAP